MTRMQGPPRMCGGYKDQPLLPSSHIIQNPNHKMSYNQQLAIRYPGQQIYGGQQMGCQPQYGQSEWGMVQYVP